VREAVAHSEHCAHLVFDSGSKYQDLKEGADITVRRLEEAVRWFSINWPDDAEWPDGIARPAKPEVAA
jgi:hypothetical protein